MPAAARRCRWARSAASSSDPSAANGVMPAANVLGAAANGSGAEAVEPHRVAGEDLLALGPGNARERRLDRAPRVGPVGADVRVIARPQDPVDTDVVAVAEPERVGHVREVEVPLDVLTGRRGKAERAHGIE